MERKGIREHKSGVKTRKVGGDSRGAWVWHRAARSGGKLWTNLNKSPPEQWSSVSLTDLIWMNDLSGICWALLVIVSVLSLPPYRNPLLTSGLTVSRVFRPTSARRLCQTGWYTRGFARALTWGVFGWSSPCLGPDCLWGLAQVYLALQTPDYACSIGIFKPSTKYENKYKKKSIIQLVGSFFWFVGFFSS